MLKPCCGFLFLTGFSNLMVYQNPLESLLNATGLAPPPSFWLVNLRCGWNYVFLRCTEFHPRGLASVQSYSLLFNLMGILIRGESLQSLLSGTIMRKKSVEKHWSVRIMSVSFENSSKSKNDRDMLVKSMGIELLPSSFVPGCLFMSLPLQCWGNIGIGMSGRLGLC